MIYCVDKPGWSIVEVEEDYRETYIGLRVGDILYAYGDKTVTSVHMQSNYNTWCWIELNKPSVNDGQTMFTHESYHAIHTHIGKRSAKCNLKMLIGNGVIDITKSVERDRKLKKLGVNEGV